MDKPPDLGELEPDWDAYIAQPQEWKDANQGKFAIFKGGKLQQVFELSTDALVWAHEQFGLERFLIYEIGVEDHPYTITQALARTS